MTAPTGAHQLLLELVAEDPGRPLLTHYEPGGARVELSRATTANWVAKTAHFLRDVVGLAPGDSVALMLPLHWRSAVILLGSWAAGVRTGFDPAAGPAAVIAAEDRLGALADPPGELVGVGLTGLTGRLADPAPGVLDYAAEVLSCADTFAPEPPPAGTLHASATRGWAAAELVAAGLADAGTPPRRVLSTAGFEEEAGLRALAAALAGGGLVLAAGLPPAELSAAARAEAVQLTAGVRLPGLAELAGVS